MSGGRTIKPSGLSAEALARGFVAAAGALGEDLRTLDPASSRARFAVAMAVQKAGWQRSRFQACRLVGCSDGGLSHATRAAWWFKRRAGEAAVEAAIAAIAQAQTTAAAILKAEPEPDADGEREPAAPAASVEQVRAETERKRDWLPKPEAAATNARPEPERVAVPAAPHVLPSARSGARSVGAPSSRPSARGRSEDAGPDPVVSADRRWEFEKVKAGRAKSPPVSWAHLSLQLGVSEPTLRGRWSGVVS